MAEGLILGAGMLVNAWSSNKASKTQASAVSAASDAQAQATVKATELQIEYQEKALKVLTDLQKESTDLQVQSYANMFELGKYDYLRADKAKASMEALLYGKPASYAKDISLGIQTAMQQTTAAEDQTLPDQVKEIMNSLDATTSGIVQKSKMDETLNKLKEWGVTDAGQSIGASGTQLVNDGKGNLVVQKVTSSYFNRANPKVEEVGKIPLSDLPGIENLKTFKQSGYTGAVLSEGNYISSKDLLTSLEGQVKNLGEQVRTGQVAPSPETAATATVPAATVSETSAKTPSAGGQYSDTMPGIAIESGTITPEEASSAIWNNPTFRAKQKEMNDALLPGLSAIGMRRGAVGQAVADANKGLVADEYESYWGKLGQLAGTTSTIPGATESFTSRLTSVLNAAGQSQANIMNQTGAGLSSLAQSSGNNAANLALASGNAKSDYYANLNNAVGSVTDYLTLKKLVG
jgi:hypothetical protein